MTLVLLSKNKCGICFGGGGERRQLVAQEHRQWSLNKFKYLLTIKSFTV